MNLSLIYISLIILSELGSILFFWFLAKYNKDKISLSSIMKGLLERAFICFSLLVGYPHVLTLFAALKIATRIKDESKISNDYYFIGNLVSVSLAILYTLLIEQHILLTG
ncbi:hypothetical protein MATR_17320 [Marivirga tractuosa]|uniref:Uncharacterized protein n=1 Tax=Marivirga tractuosa (strain ATCC 23168 / DSM 4126 / NBRC 15989 / NCIMB 1408 / VKM B-1430 / H-43) TaxID=643867 RepID=E4TQT2_MARTH|nr:hypothetical protein [Marivirga tractuosa]ADR20643.1 hypothetical protein Ftrac_0641 [Marivirga tractuosa DSM 4126]BDD14907.1 hypothetical protein MATR_17320 [Marivirga tractuosa]